MRRRPTYSLRCATWPSRTPSAKFPGSDGAKTHAPEVISLLYQHLNQVFPRIFVVLGTCYPRPHPIKNDVTGFSSTHAGPAEAGRSRAGCGQRVGRGAAAARGDLRGPPGPRPRSSGPTRLGRRAGTASLSRHTRDTIGPEQQRGCGSGAPVCPPQGLHKFPKKRNVFSGVSCCPPDYESQHQLPGYVLLSTLSLPAPPLISGSLTRPHGLGKKETTTHSFTTFSTTAAIFPAPLPQVGRPRSPQCADAEAAQGTRFLVPLRTRSLGARARASPAERASRLFAAV